MRARAAPLLCLAACVLPAGGCGDDAAYRPLWIRRLAELGRHEDVWMRYQELPKGSRRDPVARLSVLYAALESRGLPPKLWPPIIAAAVRPGASFLDVLTPLLGRLPRADAAFLHARATAISTPHDQGQTHFYLGSVRLVSSLVLVHHATRGAQGPDVTRLPDDLALAWVRDLDYVVRQDVRFAGPEHEALVAAAGALRDQLGPEPAPAAVRRLLALWLEG